MLPSLFPSLMQWREPNAYSKQDVSRHWIGGLIITVLPLCYIIIKFRDLGRSGPLLLTIFLVLGVLIFIRIWFGPGDIVRLKEDCIMVGSGNGSRKSVYEHILSCQTQKDEFEGTKFTVLKFTVKSGLPSGQIDEVVVPSDVKLASVLEILRNKGVRILENTPAP